MNKKILIITTNSNGNKDIENTGVYLEEFAVPYLIFKATGYDIETASIEGGLSPVDIRSMSCSNPIEWDDCIKVLRQTKKITDLDYDKYDALYFPGGHGPMFDIAFDEKIKKVVEYFYSKNKIIGAICHGVAGLIGAKDENNEPVVKNKKITSFTNKEEHIIKFDEFVPFLLETKLKELGANFVENKPWSEHVEVDNNIVTGQNQNSATLLAEKIIEKLN